MFKNIIIDILAISLLCFVSFESDAQSQFNIAILPVISKHGAQLDPAFIESFPKNLRDAYNRSNQSKYSALVIDTLIFDKIKLPDDSSLNYRYSITDDKLAALYEFLKNQPELELMEPFYFIQILTWKEKDPYYAEVTVFDAKTLKIDFVFEVNAVEEFKKPRINKIIDYKTELINKIIEKLIIGCSKNIRIAISEFKLDGGDTSLASFEKAIPAMIESRLLKSSRITLMESRSLNEIIAKIDSRDSSEYYFIPESLTEVAKLLFANYLITGDFLELKGSLQLNVRCINLQTSEIIAAESISSNEIELNNINDLLDEVTNKLIVALKADYLNQPRKSIAVVGLPPVENNPENRFLLMELVEVISKKLKYSSTLVVLEDAALLQKYMESPYSKWTMSSEYGSDYLMIVQLEKILTKENSNNQEKAKDHEQQQEKILNRDRTQYMLVLEFDLFEPQNPNQYYKPVSRIIPCNSESIKDVIDSVIINLYNYQIVKDSVNRKELSKTEFNIYKPYIRGWKIGGVYGNSKDLYIGARIRFVFEYEFAWVNPKNPNWFVAPALLFEFYGETGGFDKFVFGGSPFVKVNYRLSTTHVANWYFGGAIGAQGVIRFHGGDYQGGMAPALGAILGLEIHPSKLFQSWTIELKYYTGLAKIPSHQLAGKNFAGGLPGGLYLTVGRSIYF